MDFGRSSVRLPYDERDVGVEAVKPEYHEGPEALDKFKRGMESLFKVQKSAIAKKKQARKPATLRKQKPSGKDKV